MSSLDEALCHFMADHSGHTVNYYVRHLNSTESKIVAALNRLQSDRRVWSQISSKGNGHAWFISAKERNSTSYKLATQLWDRSICL